MINPFESDFLNTMVRSGMFLMSSQCSFDITPEARAAKITDWHKQQVAEIDKSYIVER